MDTQVSLRGFLVLLAATPLVLAFALAVVMRVATFLRITAPPQVIVLACGIAGNVPFGIGAYLLYPGGASSPGGALSYWIFFFLTYNALAYSFFHVFNMSDTARRIKILSEIRAAGSLRTSSLRSSYSSEEMLANRIERLLSSGQIRRSGSGYVLGSRLLYYAAKAVDLWGRVLGLAPMKSIYRNRQERAAGGPRLSQE
jgi:hypothetical protein